MEKFGLQVFQVFFFLNERIAFIVLLKFLKDIITDVAV